LQKQSAEAAQRLAEVLNKVLNPLPALNNRSMVSRQSIEPGLNGGC
jgi:hypothetical protein